MSLNKILEIAKDEDMSKEDIIEFVEDLIALRKSNIKHIITKEDALFQNVRIVSLLADAMDTVTTAMIDTQKKTMFYSPKVLAKLKAVVSTNKAFVKFNDKAFERPKGNADSGIYDFADLAEEFQEAMFKWIDEHKI